MTLRLVDRVHPKAPSPVEIDRELAACRLRDIGFTPVQARVMAAAGLDVVGWLRVDRSLLREAT